MKIVHIVPHQHFDLVWRRETSWYLNKREELYKAAFKLLKDNSETTFSFCQALPFREFINNNPEYKSLAREFFDSGRLEIIGGAESVSDLNMSRGETVLRNVRQGKKYFSHDFGYEIKAGAFEDAFGVPEQLPGMLKLSGYEFYKAGRMPRPGQNDLCGDFIWIGRDGSEIRCVSSPAECSDWGWGFPDDPDAFQNPDKDIRYQKIYSRLAHAADLEPDNLLYMMTGEEHDIPEFLPEIVRELNENVPEVEFRFSTFNNYYDSLSEEYWNNVPHYDASTDLARIFTGCYTSRIDSKMDARKLENQLLGRSISSTVGKGGEVAKHDWENLFVLQFHDAICGCHIEENAQYLKKLYQQSIIEKTFYELPWEPVLPDFRVVGGEIVDIPEGLFIFGGFGIEIIEGRLHNILTGSTARGTLCDLIMREDSGTLWTEEYSGRKKVCDADEKIILIRVDNEKLELVTGGKIDEFRKMWPGFSCLEYKKIYRFRKDLEAVELEIELDWLGNSTEVALSWNCGNADIEECRVEIPFGSRIRKAGKESGDTICGDAFPVLNWACTNDFAVFNQGTPAYAIREARMETIILRSPVKRWSPWFPVTPDLSCWNNGKRSYKFLWYPLKKNYMASELHRLGMEFNLGQNIKKSDNEIFKDLPDNLVVADAEFIDGDLALTVYEADGVETVWKNETFTPFAIKRIICL